MPSTKNCLDAFFKSLYPFTLQTFINSSEACFNFVKKENPYGSVIVKLILVVLTLVNVLFALIACEIFKSSI